jgi:hypothetical protein
MSKQHAGSSTESILVGSREKTRMLATTSQASESPKMPPPPSPAVHPVGIPVAIAGDLPSSFQKTGSVPDVSPHDAIQVRRDFTIRYGERSVQDNARLERTKRL